MCVNRLKNVLLALDQLYTGGSFKAVGAHWLMMLDDEYCTNFEFDTLSISDRA